MMNVRFLPSSLGFLSSLLTTSSSSSLTAGAFTTTTTNNNHQCPSYYHHQGSSTDMLSAPYASPSFAFLFHRSVRGGGARIISGTTAESSSSTTRLFGTNENNNNDNGSNSNSEASAAAAAKTAAVRPPPPPRRRRRRRIGIVGGGLAGVSVAHALATRYLCNSPDAAGHDVQITVLEGDPACRPNTRRYPSEGDPNNRTNDNSNNNSNSNNNNTSSDHAWSAATARNANSLVPGAAMHVFARPAVVGQVVRDTVREWWLAQTQKWGLTDLVAGGDGGGENAPFRRPPPYFALHAWRCLGLTAAASSSGSVERAAFVHFLRHFLYAAVVGNVGANDAGADRRGRLLHQLAAANRRAYREAHRQNEGLMSRDKNQTKKNNNHHSKWGHSQGFVALYRTREAAEESVREALEHGETGVQLLEPSQVTQYVPRVASLQQQQEEVITTPDDDDDEPRPLPPATTTTTTTIDYHGVRRANDHTASCELFVRHWVEEMVATGRVEYRTNARVARVSQEAPPKPKSKRQSDDNTTPPQSPVYRVTTEDGTTHEFDLLVLAAGPHTPLLADQLGALQYCPTYPLRGYSLTVFVDSDDDATKNTNNNKQSDNNLLLPQPFSLDSLYCSSVAPGMARLAGFGEFVGFAPKQQHKDENNKELVPPSVGPAVLARYAQKLFPDAITDSAAELEDAVLPCFRGLSPDDLPLAGEVPNRPGLFLHTGHGTLGWTIGLATGDCVAQAIVDRLRHTEATSSSSAACAATTTTTTQEGTFTLPDGSTMDRWILSPGRFVMTKEKATQTKGGVDAAPSSTRQPHLAGKENSHSRNSKLEPKHQ